MVINESGNRILLQSHVYGKLTKRELKEWLKLLHAQAADEGMDYACLITSPDGVITCINADSRQGWINKVCSDKITTPEKIPELLPDCIHLEKIIRKASQLRILNKERYPDLYSAIPDAIKKIGGRKPFRVPTREEFRYLMQVCPTARYLIGGGAG